MTSPGPLAEAARALAALRTEAATDVDPVTLARLQATVRRGLQHDANVQQWLADRLADALACLPAQTNAQATTNPAAPPKAPSPLRALGPAASSELRTAQRLRPTLARLRVQQQIVRAQARQPDNPGPLNSEHLLVRALQQMQTLAPGYLGPFITQVETLLWLDGARGSAASRAGAKQAPSRPPSGKAKGR